MRTMGKIKRQGRTSGPHARSAKRPIVTLTKDSKAIEFFEGMADSNSRGAYKRNAYGYHRVYKPTSPARRFMSVLTYEEITKKTPEKSLTTDLRHNAGRNNQGKITVRHQGGGDAAQVPHHRLQAQQGWHPRQGRGDRVRSQPHLPSSPCCTTPTARSATSSRPWA